MEGRECMNKTCGKSNLEEWLEGWHLKSNGFATLCHSCGIVYKNLVFCETFHSEDSGWRECASCGKRLHAGCIASCSLIELLDIGGVSCRTCSQNAPVSSAPLYDKHRSCSLMESSLNRKVDIVKPAKCGEDAETESEVGQKITSGSSDMPVEAKEILNRCKLLCVFPKLRRSGSASGLEHNSGVVRTARPTSKTTVKNQLLQRYWPRITDQELQLISGDSNSTIVPLFEKVLSASDASHIGRLVLPKACAEAYFPPITQPEGLPLRIQDIKGNEWTLQFRFWPNNNSRMYVLEGVLPCIQSMQLQAGDTVTFSRIDPDGKLVIGPRKAATSTSPLDTLNAIAFQGDLPSENAENGLLPLPVACAQRKRRNIGSQSKRLLINGQDSSELRLTWEEVQDMLRPPPSVEPSTFSIDDHEFEEFAKPPVFAKQSIFIIRLSGEYEQFTQCDSCFKWRKLPAEFLVPPKWTCQDNVSNMASSSCSVPDELSSKELECLLAMNKRIWRSLRPVDAAETQDSEPCTNAAAAISSDIEVATTTKHPRHRPGCSCIVCIQPPSGKGKHKPTCTCNVCITVKRRFKTLMMRKKKRHQSEHDAETAVRSRPTTEEETEVNSIPVQAPESQSLGDQELDLNCPPFREETTAPPPRVSMMSLLQEASLPLDTYLRQNGLKSLEIIASAHDKKDLSATTQEQEQDKDQASSQ